MKKVLIPTKLESIAADILKQKGYNVVQDATTPLADLLIQHADTQVLIVRSEEVNASVIDALPQLKLIIRAGAGYNTIDIKYARRKSIDVMNTPGANANAVAEEVVAMILANFRYIVPGDISTRAGLWEKNKFMGRELTNKTVGIVGLGNIGRLLAKRLSGFECKILAFDPAISNDLAKRTGAELTDLETIFKESDVISLHIPATPETKKLIGEKFFSYMKEDAVLVNCARFEIVDEDALREIKKSKKIHYLTDVYAKDVAGEKTVADLADLMLPHLGASTFEANNTAATRVAEQTIAYFDEGVTSCVVNKAIPDALNARYQSLASIIAKYARRYLGETLQPQQLEITLYGSLSPFFDWMISPITSGLFPTFDAYEDSGNANEFLTSRGVQTINRQGDERKAYGESITIDLFAGENPIHKVSVRGTITENKMMISRINDFRNLYLEYSGNNLFMEYIDRPGIIGKAATVLGSKNINILDVRAPQDIKAKKALAVIKTSEPLDDKIIEEIRTAIGIEAHIFTVNF